MRIFAAGLAAETNTFSPIPTALSDFSIQRGRDAQAGKLDVPNLDLARVWGVPAKAAGHEFIFSCDALAMPSGVIVRSAYESLRDEILSDLAAAMPVDVVLLMLHGAMVADGYPDCEADLLSRIRQMVGPDTVVAAEFDLHCQVTQEKIAPADIVITYKEYPHDDIYERARELFELALATRSGKIRPVMALFDCHMVGFYPTSRAPLRQIVDEMIEAEKRGEVLSVSFAHGFPFADAPSVGAKVLVVADHDHARAVAVAQYFGQRIYGQRHKIGFESLSIPMEEAFATALASKRTPVILADQSDNAGGGAPSDATFALRWMLDHQLQDAAIALIYDPQVVALATKAGVGARLSLRIGGKLGRFSGDPLDIEAEVLSIRANYSLSLPQRSAQPVLFAAGDVVALRCAGVDIVVSTKRCQCVHPSIFSDLGIDPARKRLLVVKSYQHFHAAFEPLGGEIIYMSAPGAVPPDPRLIPYRHLDTRRFYPWTDDPLGTLDHP